MEFLAYLFTGAGIMLVGIIFGASIATAKHRNTNKEDKE